MLTVLHGFTETDVCWRQLFPASFHARYEILPGHGHRPCPPGTTMTSAAAAIAARFAQPNDLVGYSMGGRLALQVALDHPATVHRLVLISTSAGIADATERADRQAKDGRLAEILDEDGIGPFVAWWESNPALKAAKPLPRRTEEDLRCLRMNQDPHGLAGALRCLGQGVMEPLWARLPELRVPTLLIAGEADAHYRRAMADMAARIPGSTLRLIHGSGHAVHREQPATLVDTVRGFLADAAA